MRLARETDPILPTTNMAATNGKSKDGKRKVLVVGAGAAGMLIIGAVGIENKRLTSCAGMSCAHHLSQHPDKFDVTIIDAVDYCGGQAFSIPIDKERHGASWLNQGVQGGSYIFHHTMTMFARQGHHADPVNLQVCYEGMNVNQFSANICRYHLVKTTYSGAMSTPLNCSLGIRKRSEGSIVCSRLFAGLSSSLP
jgi:hypothetical protein